MADKQKHFGHNSFASMCCDVCVLSAVDSAAGKQIEIAARRLLIACWPSKLANCVPAPIHVRNNTTMSKVTSERGAGGECAVITWSKSLWRYGKEENNRPESEQKLLHKAHGKSDGSRTKYYVYVEQKQ